MNNRKITKIHNITIIINPPYIGYVVKNRIKRQLIHIGATAAEISVGWFYGVISTVKKFQETLFPLVFSSA